MFDQKEFLRGEKLKCLMFGYSLRISEVNRIKNAIIIINNLQSIIILVLDIKIQTLTDDCGNRFEPNLAGSLFIVI